MNPLYRIIYTVCLLYLFHAVHAQEIPVNEYGLKVIDDVALYLETVERDSAKRLVDLGEFIPSIVLDIKYATEDNFTGKQLYPYPGAFLRYPAAVALRNVQEELKESGIGLKVWDAYRPYAATKLMWEYVRDPLPSEWWHFDHEEWREFELMDLSFDYLKTVD
jgi:zinc D-Ala-D-Ala dipeptidase